MENNLNMLKLTITVVKQQKPLTAKMVLVLERPLKHIERAKSTMKKKIQRREKQWTLP